VCVSGTEEGQLTVQLRKITICPAPSALLDGGNDYKVVCCCHGGGRESTMLSSLQSHVGGELALRLLVPQGRPLLEDLTPTISLRCDPRRIDRRLPECVILPWLPPCYASRTTTDLKPGNLPDQAAEQSTSPKCLRLSRENEGRSRTAQRREDQCLSHRCRIS